MTGRAARIFPPVTGKIDLSESFPPLTPADYDRALEMWPTELMRLGRNMALVPTWLGDGNLFWFCEELIDGGKCFRLVDPRTGASRPAFDHEVVGKALGVAADRLPFAHFTFDDEAIEFVEQGDTVRVDLTNGRVTRRPNAVPALVSAIGERLFVRDFNLQIEAPDGTRRLLTDDGQEFDAWGGGPDLDYSRIARNRAPAVRAPAGCFWSPDGRSLLARRIDERHIEPYHYLESVPLDGSPRPKLHSIRMQLSGEADGPVYSWWLIDAATGARRPVTSLPGRLLIDADHCDPIWSDSGDTVFVAAATTDATHVALLAIDTASGEVSVVHEERSDTFLGFNSYEYNRANIRAVPGEKEMIWFSEASGWGHLYALDLQNGGQPRQLTAGEWTVFDIIGMTEEAIFFTAGGREPGRNPYYRHLYRVDFSGDHPNAGLRLLTPDDADHGFSGEVAPGLARALGRPMGMSPIAPDCGCFVDAISRVDLSPVYILRDDQGREIAEIGRADISGLEAIGWLPPEPFKAKAADGLTDIYGVLVKPRAFDTRTTWPVLERIYGGPQIVAQPRSFLEGLNGTFTHAANAMAEMGFVVALLDGPGTPYRSKAFHDMPYGAFDRWGVAHHRAALEGAAATRPWMDMSCVGVSGHSYGGYGTVMAMLLEPDFYKVGVSSAGMYDINWIYSGGVQRHIGEAMKDGPSHNPDIYAQVSPSSYADRLSGHLMLVYGDLDENAMPAAMLAFARSLIKAGKSYDMVVLPGANHGFVPDPYYQKRIWDYFIEHVQGRAPLLHHKLDVQPGVRLIV